ncbi:MAG: MFS transporter [Candidatus Firestonebacteria bacterium]
MIIEQFNGLISSVIKNSLYFVDYQKIKMRELFYSLKGNARIFIVTEANWTVPIACFGLYSPIYMVALGLSKVEVGLVTSLGIAVAAIGTILGATIADRLGYKRTIMIFDSLSWPVSMLIFAFAQNIWWFIVGTIINNLCMIVLGAWQCLFVEGIPKDKRANIYAFLQIMLNGASLLVPLAGMVVDGFGLVTGCRIMYFISSISMGLGLYYRGKYLKEAEVAKQIVKEKKKYDFGEEVRKFKEAFLNIKERKQLFWYCIVQILVGFALVMWNTYYPIFLTDAKGLGLAASEISIYPFIFAVVMISIILVFIPHVKENKFKKYLVFATMFSVISALLYVFAPSHKGFFIAAAFILNGISMAFFRPLSDAYSMNLLTDAERSRIVSVFNTIIILSMVPAAPIGGYLYLINPRLTFLVVAIIFTVSILIMKFKFTEE